MQLNKLGMVCFVAAAAIAAGFLPAGCAAKRRSQQAQSVERIYAQTSFVNQSGLPVRVTVVVGERKATPPGIGTSFRGEPVVVAPDGTYKATVQETKPYGVGFLFPENLVLVMRFKVESSGPTWEQMRHAWYEVVGPVPEKIRIVAGDDGAPAAAVDSGRLELVPIDWWPVD